MSDSSQSRIGRFAKAHPRVFMATLRVLAEILEWMELRRECDNCGRQKVELNSPYGWTCMNKSCARFGQ